MARIKVTGYIDTEDMLPGDVDLNDPMGVSADFHLAVTSGAEPLPPMTDMDFKMED